MAIVYRHRRLDTNEIFYVGIGREKNRAFEKHKRNRHWENVINKTEYQVEIISEVDTWEDACELEMFLISEYGRKDLGLGPLVNMTDGGEGSLGCKSTRIGIKRSDETINKIKESMKNFSLTEEQKIKQKNNTPKGINHPNFGKGYYMKGKKHSDETRKNMSGKIIVCNVTNKEWFTIRDCAEENNINRNTLKSKLNGRLKNNTTFKYK